MKTAYILGALITMSMASSPALAGTPANTMNAVISYNSTSDGLLTCNFISSPMSYVLINENPVQFGSGILGVNIPGLNSNGGLFSTPVAGFTTVSCTYQCNVNLTTSKSGDRLLATVTTAADGLYHVATGSSTPIAETTNQYNYVTPSLSSWTPAIASGSSVTQAALVFTGYKNSGGGHKSTISAIAVNGSLPPVLSYFATTTNKADTFFNFEPLP